MVHTYYTWFMKIFTKTLQKPFFGDFPMPPEKPSKNVQKTLQKPSRAPPNCWKPSKNLQKTLKKPSKIDKNWPKTHKWGPPGRPPYTPPAPFVGFGSVFNNFGIVFSHFWLFFEIFWSLLFWLVLRLFDCIFGLGPLGRQDQHGRNLIKLAKTITKNLIKTSITIKAKKST